MGKIRNQIHYLGSLRGNKIKKSSYFIHTRFLVEMPQKFGLYQLVYSILVYLFILTYVTWSQIWETTGKHKPQIVPLLCYLTYSVLLQRKYKSRVEVRTVIILGRGEDSDRKRALGAFWGTGNVLLLVYSAGYLAMFSLQEFIKLNV